MTIRENIPSLEVDLSMYRKELRMAFMDVIDSGQLILGPQTEKIEGDFSKAHGHTQGIAVTSDTAALDAVLSIIGVKGEMVLMPEMAFFGDANVALKLGAKIGLVDIDPSNGIMPTLDQWKEAVKICSEKGHFPKVAMFVYSGGMTGDSVPAIKWLQERGILVVEDCAHCIGSKYPDGMLAGTYGDFSTWSFYATKLLQCGEGGMICTSNEADAENIRCYRAYGRKISSPPFTQAASPLGYNWRLTEIQAAFLNVMWGHKDEVIAERQKVATVYDQFFRSGHDDDGSGKAYRLQPEAGGTVNLYRYMIMKPKMTINDNIWMYEELKTRAHSFGLQEKTNHMPLSAMEAYHSLPTILSVTGDFSGASRFSQEHLNLPIYPTLPSHEAEYIAKSMVTMLETMGI